jgi:hypothetical protein
MSQNFHIVEINPNDNTGGGGCLCSETKDTDCKPPYAVFYTQEMASNLSPHAVVCATCLNAATKALDGEVQAGGQKNEFIDVPEEDIEEIPEDTFDELRQAVEDAPIL